MLVVVLILRDADDDSGKEEEKKEKNKSRTFQVLDSMQVQIASWFKILLSCCLGIGSCDIDRPFRGDLAVCAVCPLHSAVLAVRAQGGRGRLDQTLCHLRQGALRESRTLLTSRWDLQIVSVLVWSPFGDSPDVWE